MIGKRGIHMAEATQKQLDREIKAVEAKIEKYKEYIVKLNQEKKSLAARKRKLEAEKAKAAKAGKASAGKTSSAKKTASAKRKTAKPAAKKQPSLLEGILDEVRKSGDSQGGNLLEQLLEQLKDGQD